MTKLLTVKIARDEDVVSARQRARQVAEALNFDAQQQTRVATAVSEIARNVARYAGGGQVEFALDLRAAGAGDHRRPIAVTAFRISRRSWTARTGRKPAWAWASSAPGA